MTLYMCVNVFACLILDSYKYFYTIPIPMIATGLYLPLISIHQLQKLNEQTHWAVTMNFFFVCVEGRACWIN